MADNGSFDLGSVVAHITADLSGFTDGLNQAKEQASSFGEKMGGIAESIRGFAEKAAVVVGAQSLAFGELAHQAIDVASNFEQTQTSFGTLLGSEQKAADLMKEIMLFEQHTPFDIDTLTTAAKNLLAFGVTQEQVVPKMKEFTDMSQGQTAKLNELVSIYGEVNSIQQLNGREVLRLTSIGVPIYQALEDHFKKMGGAAKDAQGNITDLTTTTVNNSKMTADARMALTDRLKEEQDQLTIDEQKTTKTNDAKEKLAHTIMTLKDHISEATQKLGTHTTALGSMGGAAELTGTQIKDMISKGEVSSKVFDDVLSEMTSKGGLYFNENIRQMSTFAGTMSSVKSQFQYALLNIMGIDLGAANEVRKGGLFYTLRGLAADLLDWLHRLQPMLNELGSNPLFIKAIEGFVIALGSLVIILPIVIAAMNPIVLVVFAIEAAIVLLYMAWSTNFGGIRDITKSVIGEIQHFFKDYLTPLIAEFMVFWKAAWPIISEVLQFAWQGISANIKMYWDICYGILKVGIDLLTGNWKKAWNDIKDIFTNIWGDLNKQFGGALDFIKDWGGKVLSAMVKPFEDAWSSISATVNKIKNALDFTQRHSPSVLDVVQNGVALVNQALVGIQFQPNVSAAQIGTNIITSTGMNIPTRAGTGMQVVVNLPNSIIADNASATRVSEMIGNSIIKRLQQNVRF